MLLSYNLNIVKFFFNNKKRIKVTSPSLHVCDFIAIWEKKTRIVYKYSTIQTHSNPLIFWLKSMCLNHKTTYPLLIDNILVIKILKIYIKNSNNISCSLHPIFEKKYSNLAVLHFDGCCINYGYWELFSKMFKPGANYYYISLF